MKPLLTWQTSYSIGNKVLDDQHRNLVRAINMLYEIIDSPSKAQVLEVFSLLCRYCDEHFTTEEYYMRSSQFPGVEPHVVDHAKLKTDLEEFRVKFEKHEHILPRLLLYLVSWFNNHMMERDQEFSRFLYAIDSPLIDIEVVDEFPTDSSRTSDPR